MTQGIETPQKRRDNSPHSQSRKKLRLEIREGQPLPLEETEDATSEDSMAGGDLAKDAGVKKKKLRPSWALTSVGKGMSKSVATTGRVRPREVIVISSDESSHYDDSSEDDD